MKEWLKKTVDVTAGVGAVNWGLSVFLNFNLVNWLSTAVSQPVLGKIVYGGVAIAGGIVIYNHLPVKKKI